MKTWHRMLIGGLFGLTIAITTPELSNTKFLIIVVAAAIGFSITEQLSRSK